MRHLISLSALCAALVSASCAETYHVDDASGRSLILGANDRVVLTRGRPDDEAQASVVCAEPNPDVAVGRNINVTLNATVSPQGAAPSGSGSLSGNETETLLALTRTNAVQVLRDVGYRACEAYMNGAIDALGYDRILHGTATTITAVVAIDALGQIKQPDSAGKIREVVSDVFNVSSDGRLATATQERLAARSPSAN